MGLILILRSLISKYMNKKETKREYRRRWYLANKEKEKERARKWQKKNKDRASAINRVTCANSRYPGFLSVDDVLEVIKKGKHICYWCKKEKLSGSDLTLEHLKPINDKRFLVIACRSCNAKKLQRDPFICKCGSNIHHAKNMCRKCYRKKIKQ